MDQLAEHLDLVLRKLVELWYFSILVEPDTFDSKVLSGLDVLSSEHFTVLARSNHLNQSKVVNYLCHFASIYFV